MIDNVRSMHMNFYDFYAWLCGQNNIKHKQLVKTADFNASR
jgi:hypothetical protein